MRVEAHEFVPEDVSNGRHAHGGTGMPGIGFEGSIDLDQHIENKSMDAAQAWSGNEGKEHLTEPQHEGSGGGVDLRRVIESC